jgi:hypothetical protein
MYYILVNPRLDPTIHINYYQENKFGINMIKTHINILKSPLVIVAFAYRKIIHSKIFHLLSGMYKM